MSTYVTLRGMLEPLVLEDDLPTLLKVLNLTASEGKPFVMGRLENGSPFLMNITNILSAYEEL